MRKAVVIAMLVGAGCSSAPTAPVGSADSGSAPATTEPAPEMVEELPPHDVEWAVVGARAAHTATTLPDGGVLIAGGCVVDGCGVATDETFVVSPDGERVTAGPSMSSPRDAHTATVLSDGRVVLIGGYPGEGAGVLASIDLVDPVSATNTVPEPLRQPRGGHAAALTRTGDVLVVGGWIGSRRYTATAELFEPATGRTRVVADAPYGADALDAVVLQDGRVLVTGGQIAPAEATAAAAIFDPRTGAWSSVGDMAVPRLKHFSVGLADGRVLVMGGSSDDENLLRTTEIFDPSTDRFTPGPDMSEERYKFPGGAVLLPDGRVAIAGGGRVVEILDVDDGASDILNESTRRGSFATLNLLGSGDLLVVGGYDDRIRLRYEAFLVPTSSR